MINDYSRVNWTARNTLLSAQNFNQMDAGIEENRNILKNLVKGLEPFEEIVVGEQPETPETPKVELNPLSFVRGVSQTYKLYLGQYGRLREGVYGYINGLLHLGNHGGRIILRDNAPDNQAWASAIEHNVSSAEDEQVVFSVSSPKIGWMFACEDVNGNSLNPLEKLKDWQNLKPIVHIQNGRVAINKQVESKLYDLEVDGRMKAWGIDASFLNISGEDAFQDFHRDCGVVTSLPTAFRAKEVYTIGENFNLEFTDESFLMGANELITPGTKIVAIRNSKGNEVIYKPEYGPIWEMLDTNIHYIDKEKNNGDIRKGNILINHSFEDDYSSTSSSWTNYKGLPSTWKKNYDTKGIISLALANGKQDFSKTNIASSAKIPQAVIGQLSPLQCILSENTTAKVVDEWYLDNSLFFAWSEKYIDFKKPLKGYVKEIDGKGLSTNDYTTAEKEKLASLNNYDDTDILNGTKTLSKIRVGTEYTTDTGKNLKNGRIVLRKNPTGYWASGIQHSVSGSKEEQVLFINSQGTEGNHIGWIFADKNANGSQITIDSQVDWENLLPALHIKDNKVAINKLIADQTSLNYELDVNGSGNFKKLNINGNEVMLTDSDGTLHIGDTKLDVNLRGAVFVDDSAVNDVMKVIQPDGTDNSFISFGENIYLNAKNKVCIGATPIDDIFVAKEENKGLSSNDYTDDEKEKLASYPELAILISGNVISTGVTLTANKKQEKRVGRITGQLELKKLATDQFSTDTFSETYIVFNTSNDSTPHLSFGYEETAITVYFVGDDCLDGVFTPMSNMLYELFIWWNGFNFQGIARGVPYDSSSTTIVEEPINE